MTDRSPFPARQEALQNQLLEASVQCLDALKLSIAADSLEEALANFRKAGRRIHRAQEILLPLCPSIPAVNGYFLNRQSAIAQRNLSPPPDRPPQRACSMAALMKIPTHGAAFRFTFPNPGHDWNPFPSSSPCTGASATGGISSGHGSVRRAAGDSFLPALPPSTSPGRSRRPVRRTAAAKSPRLCGQPVEHRLQPHPAHGSFRRGDLRTQAHSRHPDAVHYCASSRAFLRPLT